MDENDNAEPNKLLYRLFIVIHIKTVQLLNVQRHTHIQLLVI